MLIVGNQRTRRETILREVQLKSGQPLSQQQEDETRTRITALGLFRRVDISYLQLPGEQNHRDVVITVEEAPVTTIGYGGGLEGGKRLVRSSETRRRRRGIPGRATRVLSGQPPQPVRQGPIARLCSRASASVRRASARRQPRRSRMRRRRRRIRLQRIPRAADLSASGAFSAPTPMPPSARASSRACDRASTSTAAAPAPSLTRRVTPHARGQRRATASTTRELLNIKSNFAAQPEIDRLFPQVRLSSVSSSLIRDTRNDSLEPTSGSLIGADAELAARRIGSEVGFLQDLRAGIHLSAACRRPSSTVLALRRAPGARDRISARSDQRDGTDDRRRRPARERAVLCRRRYDRPRICARSAGHARDDRPGRLSDRRSRADRAERRAAHSGARRPWRRRVHRRRATCFGTVNDMDLARDARLRSASASAIDRRSGRFASTWASNSIGRSADGSERERPTALHISLGQAF